MPPPALLPSLSANLPMDWIIIGIFVFLVALDALRSGGARAAVLGVAFPLSVFLYNQIPQTYYVGALLKGVTNPIPATAIFFGVFAAAYLISSRLVNFFGEGARGITTAFLSAGAATIITLVSWLQVPVLTTAWHFGPHIQTVFGLPYALPWLLLAYLALAFVRS